LTTTRRFNRFTTDGKMYQSIHALWQDQDYRRGITGPRRGTTIFTMPPLMASWVALGTFRNKICADCVARSSARKALAKLNSNTPFEQTFAAVLRCKVLGDCKCHGLQYSRRHAPFFGSNTSHISNTLANHIANGNFLLQHHRQYHVPMMKS